MLLAHEGNKASSITVAPKVSSIRSQRCSSIEITSAAAAALDGNAADSVLSDGQKIIAHLKHL